MRPHLPLAAAALLAAAVRPAAAQHAVAPHARPTAVADSTAPVTLRGVANYRFSSPARAVGLPDRVAIRDSVGVLVASFQLPGASDARPMRIEILNDDLVLQGETPSGLLTLRLFGQNAALPGVPFTGRWWLGRDEGVLRGRSTP